MQAVGAGFARPINAAQPFFGQADPAPTANEWVYILELWTLNLEPWIPPASPKGKGFLKTQHPVVTNPALPEFSVSQIRKHAKPGNSVYSYRWGRTVKTVSFPFVHNRHSPCEHSFWRLFITTPIGCEHSERHLFTRRAAVVNKWWGDSIFRLLADNENV